MPFVALAIYDCMLLKTHFVDMFRLEPLIADYIEFWGGLLVVPATILIGGGYFARQLNPASRFGAIALIVSALTAAANPLVITCWSLSLGGGACT
jgi:hypothetical protein